jgi:thioredoxin-related protein
MRVPSFAIAVFCGLFTLAGTVRGDEVWQSSFEAARKRAQAEGKPLLVNFTGSDWCVFCKLLKKAVFDTGAFQKGAPRHFVLVEVDFPRAKKLPAGLKEQNEALAKKYGIRAFPTVLVLGADGQYMARTGYRKALTAEDYVAQLVGFVKTYDGIGALKAKARALEGLDRARALDHIVGQYDQLGGGHDEIGVLTREIVQLDADNRAGLKTKYSVALLVTQARSSQRVKAYDKARAALDEALAIPGIGPIQQQEVQLLKGQCLLAQMEPRKALDSFRSALAAAPQGPQADAVRTLIRLTEKKLNVN